MLQLDELRHEAFETVQQLLGLIEQVSKISILQKIVIQLFGKHCAELNLFFPSGGGFPCKSGKRELLCKILCQCGAGRAETQTAWPPRPAASSRRRGEGEASQGGRRLRGQLHSPCGLPGGYADQASSTGTGV